MLGYSEGSFRANDDTFTSGGQCEDGLKMILLIGELEVPTTKGNKNHSLIDSQIVCLLVNGLIVCFIIFHAHARCHIYYRNYDY